MVGKDKTSAGGGWLGGRGKRPGAFSSCYDSQQGLEGPARKRWGSTGIPRASQARGVTQARAGGHSFPRRLCSGTAGHSHPIWTGRHGAERRDEAASPQTRELRRPVLSRPGLRNTELCPRGQAEARERGTECLTVDLRQEEDREGGHRTGGPKRASLSPARQWGAKGQAGHHRKTGRSDSPPQNGTIVWGKK